MNNLRLLTGLTCIALSGAWVRAYGQTVYTLEDIFDIVETNSAQLQPYFTAQDAADRGISLARNERLPEISASLSLSYNGDGFTTKRDFSDRQKAPIPHFGNALSVYIDQPVYTGGAISNSVKLAELKSTVSRYATDFQRDNIRFRITGFYLDIYKNTNLRSVIKGNIDAAQKILEEMRARYEQGTALLNDITRYELLVSNLRLQLVRIDNTLGILNSNLVTVAGLPEGTVIAPDSTILQRSLPINSETWWQSEARENTPTLKLARVEVEISRRAEAIVRADRLPKVGLRAGWSFDGPILVEVPPINRNLSYWYVGVGVSYNLSSLYKNNKSLAAKRLETKRAIEALEASQDNIAMAVRTDHIHYLEAYEELKTQQKSVELAERNYNTVATRYTQGMALITDMLDAANARIDAQQQLVNARIDIIYYYYKLLFTTGKI